MKVPSKAALFLAGWVCIAGTAWPQATPPRTESAPRVYFIRGTVRHAETSVAMNMVKVDLKRFTGETIATRFTRTTGDFEFAGLSRGSYILVVEAAGYETLQESVELISGPRSGIQLFLRKLPPTDPQSNRHVVSVRELSLPRKAREAYLKGVEAVHDHRTLNCLGGCVSRL